MNQSAKWGKTEEPLIERVPGLYYPKFKIMKELLEDEGVLYNFRLGIIQDIYTLYYQACILDNVVTDYVFDTSFTRHPMKSYAVECRARLNYYTDTIPYKEILKDNNYSLVNSTVQTLKLLDAGYKADLLYSRTVRSDIDYKSHVRSTVLPDRLILNKLKSLLSSIVYSQNRRFSKTSIESYSDIPKLKSIDLVRPDFKYRMYKKIGKVVKKGSNSSNKLIIIEDTSVSMLCNYYKQVNRHIKEFLCSINMSITYITYNSAKVDIQELNSKEDKVRVLLNSKTSYCPGKSDLNKVISDLPDSITGHIVIISDGEDKVDEDVLKDRDVHINIISRNPCDSLIKTSKKTMGTILKLT